MDLFKGVLVNQVYLWLFGMDSFLRIKNSVELPRKIERRALLKGMEKAIPTFGLLFLYLVLIDGF